MKFVKGALAGTVGVWALERVTWFLWDREDPKTLQLEQKARPDGLDPAHMMAKKLADVFDVDIEPDQPNMAGIATHFAVGILPAAVYAAMRSPGKMDLKRGLMLGLGLFVVQDEIANPLLGLSGHPGAYPWQAHARGLAGHLAYGATVEGSLAAIDRASRHTKYISGPADQPFESAYPVEERVSSSHRI